jgi:endonuclease G, mitochondrial
VSTSNTDTSIQISAPSSATGETIITVPLQIRIQLGTPVVVPPAGRPPTGPGTGRRKEGSAPRDVKEALERLREAREGKYYDEDEDRTAAEGYYQGIDPSDSPGKLFDALSELLESTHSDHVRYSPAVELYPDIDLQEDGTLKSIYSGADIDVEEAIRHDFEALRTHERALESLRERESALSVEERVEEMVELERQLQLNCEHVVPQSWFSKKEPQRGDLHHLFACESNCNSFRSNIPYGGFGPEDESIMQDCGRREEDRFEPHGGAGAVARATLYFCLRYPRQFRAKGQKYFARHVELLKRWHDEHPVTRYERHRNARIFARQGNRNPLIDHPEWAARIDFAKGL